MASEPSRKIVVADGVWMMVEAAAAAASLASPGVRANAKKPELNK